MQSIDLIKKYAYGTSKDLVSESEEILFNKTTTKMINFGDVTKENLKEKSPN